MSTTKTIEATGVSLRLKKVDFLAVGIYAEWIVDVVMEDESTVPCEGSGKMGIEIHPDLNKALEKLKSHLGRIVGIEEKKWASISVTGVTIDDLDGEKPRGLISGKVPTIDGQKSAMSTPFVKLKSSAYPHKSKMLEVLQKVEQEARDYLFRGKCANPTLFDQVHELWPKMMKAS